MKVKLDTEARDARPDILKLIDRPGVGYIGIVTDSPCSEDEPGVKGVFTKDGSPLADSFEAEEESLQECMEFALRLKKPYEDFTESLLQHAFNDVRAAIDKARSEYQAPKES